MVGNLMQNSDEMIYENNNCKNASWWFLSPEVNTNCIHLKDPLKASIGKIQRVSSLMEQIANICFHFSVTEKTDDILMV